MSHVRFGRARRLGALLAGLALAGSMTLGATASTGSAERYLVVFSGSYALDGSYALGGNYALNHEYALGIVKASGGTVTTDLSKQIGVMVVESASSEFYALLASYALVEEVGLDWSWQGIPAAGDAPETHAEPAEALQWDMAMIRTSQAHGVQAGRPQVQVGVLDSGISGRHPDFQKDGGFNVDCDLGHDSLAVLPAGVAVGNPTARTWPGRSGRAPTASGSSASHRT